MTDERPPSIQERYSTARQTSDLSLDPLTSMSPADVLTASGWAAQENEAAMLLWGVVYQGKTSDKLRLVEVLGSQLNAKMGKDRRLKGDAWKIAAEMLAWFLHGTCRPCGGLGYERTPGTPALSNRLCKVCQGTKRAHYPRSAAHIWMDAHLGSLTAKAGGEVMKKLARSMEL